MAEVKLPPMGIEPPAEKPAIDEKALGNVLNDRPFMENLLVMQTPEEVQTALKEKGVDLSLTDINVMGQLLKKMEEKGTTELTPEDLKSIGGGGEVTDVLKASAKVVGQSLADTLTLGLYTSIPHYKDKAKEIDANKKLSDKDKETAKEALQLGVASRSAGIAVGLLAVAGAGYAFAKRKKIFGWFKKKF